MPRTPAFGPGCACITWPIKQRRLQPFGVFWNHCSVTLIMGFHGLLNKVEGVEGIMAAYASALHNVSLSGPTLFGQVINNAAQIASRSTMHNSNKYLVLLIITDGVLTDLQETKYSLVRVSDLPLSILIVGVGEVDFTQMEILDADNGRRLERSTGRLATRDIVQFVPMREVHVCQKRACCGFIFSKSVSDLPAPFGPIFSLRYMPTDFILIRFT
ncbi:Copine domain-containing protein [Cephalotus follicularis]|uniref:Copine domain-containing protein n=1 Tax=Cephalotus follicularis TaxID=3775 RepID=A0A1Q3CHT2_CEPFO|nr:Copine domain-containing protein [Cephalotus follicularis]